MPVLNLIQVLEIAPQVTITEAKIEQESQRVGPCFAAT